MSTIELKKNSLGPQNWNATKRKKKTNKNKRTGDINTEKWAIKFNPLPKYIDQVTNKQTQWKKIKRQHTESSAQVYAICEAYNITHINCL